MELLLSFYAWIDPILIFFYRIPENSMAGFFLGTFVLSLLCVPLGEVALVLVARANRSHYLKLKGETVRMHNLSVKAILSKEKEAYTSCNKIANEAFGRYFFAQLGLGASALWPLPFALGWMSTRFSEVTFPLPFAIPGIGDSVAYPAVFIPLYIFSRIIFGKMRPHIPILERPELSLESGGKEKMMSWNDLAGTK
jgi:hypothetical protein